MELEDEESTRTSAAENAEAFVSETAAISRTAVEYGSTTESLVRGSSLEFFFYLDDAWTTVVRLRRRWQSGSVDVRLLETDFAVWPRS